jgi:hypothetical protein
VAVVLLAAVAEAEARRAAEVVGRPGLTWKVAAAGSVEMGEAAPA